jgi:hypothetical protein
LAAPKIKKTIADISNSPFLNVEKLKEPIELFQQQESEVNIIIAFRLD